MSSDGMSDRLARAAALSPRRPPDASEADELVVSAVLGSGEAAYAQAAERLATWATHQLPGMRTESDGRSDQLGATVLIGLGAGRTRVWFGCRVVEVVDEHDGARRRIGYSYATLPGHPERGVERFTVELAPDGTVTGHVQAWSRPAWTVLTILGPVPRWVQRRIAAQYLRRLRAR